VGGSPCGLHFAFVILYRCICLGVNVSLFLLSCFLGVESLGGVGMKSLATVGVCTARKGGPTYALPRKL